jgi:transcriptional regulator with XRE-family HTH domain
VTTRRFLGTLTPAQVRAARALLRWPQSELANRSGAGLNTIKSLESERSNPMPKTLIALEKALREAGVEFIEAKEGKGPGVRFTKDRSAIITEPSERVAAGATTRRARDLKSWSDPQRRARYPGRTD